MFSFDRKSAPAPKFPYRAFPVRILLMPTSNVNSKAAFTLIEVLLSMFFLIAMVTILLSASGTLLHTRTSNLQTIATKIATKQIENLRNTAYASLPGSGTFADSDLSQLPQGTATRTIANYQSSADIKDVLVIISYIENGSPRNVNLETLIYKNGL